MNKKYKFLIVASTFYPKITEGLLNGVVTELTRLKFKFRYHDGRTVQFKCLPLSFSIEFNMLRDEQLRNRVVRIPGLYRL